MGEHDKRVRKVARALTGIASVADLAQHNRINHPDMTNDELWDILRSVEDIVASYSMALKIFLMEIHSGFETALIAETKRMAAEDAKSDADDRRACQYAIEDANYWLSGVLADHTRNGG
ncbi:MAG: hypothetical protein JKY94_09990 [Rhodobacteraceae bacterium]|nr:hypothetical protein [Paracoccaceae bacterium]